ncbi:unnamed protein product [Symbiodinium sp. CCMP2592]|nr:unnamed protein product [Symbiodinium sp. CCMP2592]
MAKALHCSRVPRIDDADPNKTSMTPEEKQHQMAMDEQMARELQQLQEEQSELEQLIILQRLEEEELQLQELLNEQRALAIVEKLEKQNRAPSPKAPTDAPPIVHAAGDASTGNPDNAETQLMWSACAASEKAVDSMVSNDAVPKDEDEDDMGDTDADSSGGTKTRAKLAKQQQSRGRGRGRGRGRQGKGKGRGRGRGCSTNTAKEGDDEDEPASPRASSIKRGNGNPEPETRKKSKGRNNAPKEGPETKEDPSEGSRNPPKEPPLAKSKAKKKEEKPTAAKSKAKKKEKEPPAAEESAPPKTRSKRTKNGPEEPTPEELEKLKKSRKSCAYHKAKKEAEKKGLSAEEIKEAARKVLVATVRDSCLNLSLLAAALDTGRSIDKNGKSIFRGKAQEMKQSGFLGGFELASLAMF